MTIPKARLTILFSIFAFVFPLMSVLLPKGVVALLLVTAALAGLVVSRSERRPPLPDLRVAGVLAVLVLWCGLASLWSFDVPSALMLTARIGVIFAAGLFLFAVAGDQDEDSRRKIGKWLLIGMLTGLAIMVVEVAFDSPLVKLIHEPGPRKAHWRVRLNHGATVMAILVWPAAAILWRSGGRKLAVLLPLLVAVILSFLDSAAALLGLAAGGSTALLAASHRKAGRIILLVASVAVLIGAPLAGKQFYAHGLHQADWLFKSARQRVEIWNFSVERIVEKPILGWGFDASRNMEKLYIEREETGGPMVALHPHDAPLQILLELGAVGGLISLALLWLLAARLEMLPSPSRIFGQALYVAALTIALVSFGLWQNQWLSMLISAALMVPMTARPAA